jgi:hypothetical protein
LPARRKPAAVSPACRFEDHSGLLDREEGDVDYGPYCSAHERRLREAIAQMLGKFLRLKISNIFG